MFTHGVMAEVSRLKWENELYQKEIRKYHAALKAAHQIVHTVPGTPDSVIRIIDVVLDAAIHNT